MKDLVRKGRDLERLVVAVALRWHLQDRILVDESCNKIVVSDHLLGQVNRTQR